MFTSDVEALGKFSSSGLMQSHQDSNRDVPIAELPEISAFSFDSDIEAGREVQLLCYVPKGDLPISFNWYFNGQELILRSDINTVKLGSRSSVLTITETDHSHSGMYTCAASNAVGMHKSSASLVVHGSHKTYLYYQYYLAFFLFFVYIHPLQLPPKLPLFIIIVIFYIFFSMLI